MPAVANTFQIIRTAPAFSGTRGQISHTDGALTKSGQKISEEGALRIAAIWIANTVLADEVASLVQRIIRSEDKNRTQLRPSALRALWSDEPNPDQTKFGIDATETMSMTLWGASYTMLGWTRGNELDVRWPIDPANVQLERLDGGGLKLTSPGQGELLNRRGERPEFCYIPMYVLPGQLTPVSPVRMAAELAGLSQAYQETSARLMGRGLNPAAVLTFGGPIPQETAEGYSRELERIHGGSAKSGGVAVVGGPTPKLERLSMSMADAEFIAQNEYVFKLLLAMWRVPPTVAGMVDKPSTWGTGVAEFSRGLERFTLRPIVQRRQAAHQKYITNWVDSSLQVKYIFDSLLSAAPRDRAEIQRTRLMSGTTSVERILAQEDEPPFDEEETVFTQLSLATTGDRDLELLKKQAASAQALIDVGVPKADAFTAAGIEVAPASEPDPAAPPQEDVQAAALNGAQIASLLTIIQQVTAKQLSPETAKEVLRVSFPSLDDAQISKLIDSAAAFEPRAAMPEVVA